jgi:hypothetical protein
MQLSGGAGNVSRRTTASQVISFGVAAFRSSLHWVCAWSFRFLAVVSSFVRLSALSFRQLIPTSALETGGTALLIRLNLVVG